MIRARHVSSPVKAGPLGRGNLGNGIRGGDVLMARLSLAPAQANVSPFNHQLQLHHRTIWGFKSRDSCGLVSQYIQPNPPNLAVAPNPYTNQQTAWCCLPPPRIRSAAVCESVEREDREFDVKST